MKLWGGKPVLYMKEIHFFCKWNSYGNTPAGLVCVNLLRLTYIGGAKIISRRVKKKKKEGFVTAFWTKCGQAKWVVNHFKQNIFCTL